MPHKKSSTEERILEAAGQLFSKQGFNGTSTREIARLADVNEGSLFRLFTSKRDLFWAAVKSQLDRLRPGKDLQSGLAQTAAPQIVVPLIMEFLVQAATFHPELTRLLQVALLELRPTAERVCRQQVAPIVHALCEYLAVCVKNGQIRSVDPDILVYSIISSVLAHQNLHSLLHGTNPPYATTDDAIASYSRFWVNLLMSDRLPAATASIRFRNLAAEIQNGYRY
jgi:AcrR family transcriptional regulator